MWSFLFIISLPTEISCGNAGELPHGEFQYEGDTVVGERVYAVCREGWGDARRRRLHDSPNERPGLWWLVLRVDRYTLKGLNYMTCKTSGWTGEFPTCVGEKMPQLHVGLYLGNLSHTIIALIMNFVAISVRTDVYEYRLISDALSRKNILV